MAPPSTAGLPGDESAPAGASGLSRFLDEHHRAFLVTLRPDGGPTAHPMGLIPKDGRIYFNTYRKSAKVRNIERDPRVCCLAASPDQDPAFAAVAVSGRGGVVPADAVPDSLLAGSSTAMGAEDLERVRARLRTGKRVYVEVSADAVRFCEPLAPVPDPLGSGPEGAALEAVRPETAPGETRPPETCAGRGSPIAMSPAEVAAYVQSRDVAALASLDGTGAPRAIAVRYILRAGSLVALVPQTAPTVEDVAGDRRVCVTVEEFPTYDTIKGVMLHGRAVPLRGEAAGAGLAESFVPLRIVVTHVVSFDFARIAARPAAALP